MQFDSRVLRSETLDGSEQQMDTVPDSPFAMNFVLIAAVRVDASDLELLV